LTTANAPGNNLKKNKVFQGFFTRKVIFYSKDPGEREGTRLNKNSPPMPLV
jgi:hypothetical protein